VMYKVGFEKAWEETLCPAPWIISCISEGYKLPLRAVPNKYSRPSQTSTVYSRPNQQSALDNNDFVSESIRELESNCCVARVFEYPHICGPLSVVANSVGKLRLILNLRYLNQFLWLEYKDLWTAMLMFQKGDYVFSFDLKSGYHCI